MSAAAWRRAAPADAGALLSLAKPREAYATGFSHRAFTAADGSLAEGKAGVRIYALPSPAGSGLDAAVLFTSSGTAFPLLGAAYERGGPAAVEALEGLRRSRFARAFEPGVCLGARDHVDALAKAFRWKPAIAVEYDAMALDAQADAGRARASGADRDVGGLPPGTAIRRASPSDLEALLPLAEAYERAEVLTSIHVFDPAACRASQARSLSRLSVFIALVGGRIAARAQTNARGLGCEQIGGVFVEPDYRRRGLGRAVVSALVSDIAGRGKSASLFVKKSNVQARDLYLSLGFEIVRDYVVAYFRPAH